MFYEIRNLIYHGSVQVHADHTSIAELLSEFETESTLRMTDTANINVLETEILLSRVRNEKKINYTP